MNPNNVFLVCSRTGQSISEHNINFWLKHASFLMDIVVCIRILLQKCWSKFGNFVATGYYYLKQQ